MVFESGKSIKRGRPWLTIRSSTLTIDAQLVLEACNQNMRRPSYRLNFERKNLYSGTLQRGQTRVGSEAGGFGDVAKVQQFLWVAVAVIEVKAECRLPQIDSLMAGSGTRVLLPTMMINLLIVQKQKNKRKKEKRNLQNDDWVRETLKPRVCFFGCTNLRLPKSWSSARFLDWLGGEMSLILNCTERKFGSY